MDWVKISLRYILYHNPVFLNIASASRTLPGWICEKHAHEDSSATTFKSVMTDDAKLGKLLEFILCCYVLNTAFASRNPKRIDFDASFLNPITVRRGKLWFD